MLLLAILLLASSTEAFCITRTGFYIAAKALAVGIGNVTSSAACKFSSVTGIDLNSDCPPQCALLIRTTWGDCYCEQPSFVPAAGDAPFSNYTAQQLFEFIAGVQDPSLGLQAHCRDWMNLPSSISSWACNSTSIN